MKKTFKNTPEGTRPVGKKRKRLLDDAENDLKKMGLKGVGEKQGQKHLETDPERGQGNTWTVQQVKRDISKSLVTYPAAVAYLADKK